MSSVLFKSLICTLALALLPLSPAWADKALPEVDKDGLHLLKDSKAKAVYTKEGASLDKYTKVKLVDCFVAFRKGYEHDYNLDHIGLDGRISDRDIEKIKKGLAAEFNKQFTKVLTKKGHAVVDEVGPDVLLLRPAIINLDITAPDTLSAGFRRVVVRSAGQMTLYMELYDSATSTLLARVIDPEADQFGGVANRVTNKADADRIIRDWAETLSDHLGDVKQKSAK